MYKPPLKEIITLLNSILTNKKGSLFKLPAIINKIYITLISIPSLYRVYDDAPATIIPFFKITIPQLTLPFLILRCHNHKNLRLVHHHLSTI